MISDSQIMSWYPLTNLSEEIRFFLLCDSDLFQISISNQKGI